MGVGIFFISLVPYFFLVYGWFRFYFFVLSHLLSRARSSSSNRGFFWFFSLVWGAVCLVVLFCFVLLPMWLPYKLGLQSESNSSLIFGWTGLIIGFVAVIFAVRKQKQINSSFFGGY